MKFKTTSKSKLEKQAKIYNAVKKMMEEEKSKIKTIEEWMNFTLKTFKYENSSIGVVNLKSMYNYLQVYKNTDHNIIIFDNSGNTLFDIWELPADKKSSHKKLMKELKPYMYCSRINGVEKIHGYVYIPNSYYDSLILELEKIHKK